MSIVAVRPSPGLAAPPPLPCPRGPLSSFLIDALRRPAHRLDAGLAVPAGAIDSETVASWTSDDFQLALYVCYELHYRSFAGVDERWEWEPSLLAFRRNLEDVFERGVRDLVPRAGHTTDVAAALWEMIATASGPSLSTFVSERATRTQLREFLVHRSAYQLKEADPHTWAIPRLAGEAKAAMVHIQADEYGNGVEAAMHSSLFADTLVAADLDPRYGMYLDRLPGPTLATVNLVSMFGLHRRFRGALVGHLAIFEMTSIGPMGRYAAAVRRLGVAPAGWKFYDVHVEADAEHQFIAADRMAAGLAAAEPALVDDILFGAEAIMAVEGRFALHLLNSWEAGHSSLCRPLPDEPTTG
ncbi:MAG: iron-containing redox enzyme family protein [Acidimicrobiales bacterium]